MIFGEVINLVAYGSFGGGAVGTLLAQWEAAGVFAYALPFFLIFALVFSILGFIPIFKSNKGIIVTISLVVALMALQFGFVGEFFSQIFWRLGIGLGVMLVFIILLGLLVQDSQKSNKIIRWMFGIAILVITIVVISGAFNSFGFVSGGGQFWYFLRSNLVAIFTVLLMVGLFIAIVFKRSNQPRKIPDFGLGHLARGGPTPSTDID